MNLSLLSGVLFGLAAGLSPGPLLALVVSQTVRHGTREGLKTALAPLVTDVPIILASVLLLARLTGVRPLLGVISLAGGLYVGYLAWESLRTGPVPLRIEEKSPDSLRRGAVVNLLNPHPYLFWITVGGPLLLEGFHESLLSAMLFLGGFYGLLVGSKIALAALVGRSRSFLHGRVYLWTLRGLGGLLAVFSGLLLWEAARYWLV